MVGRVAPVAVAAAVLASALISAPAVAAPEDGALAPVVQQVLQGDLVMAGNSNLLSAGGWRADGQEVADVDGDSSALCVGRTYVPAACADNSSSATLDVPAGARVVAARLYVDTTLSSSVRPIRVRLDGPAEGFEYLELTSAARQQRPQARRGVGLGGRGTRMRQAVWDVTDFVQSGGPGAYTVADIVVRAGRARSCRTRRGRSSPPTSSIRPPTWRPCRPEQQARFAPRERLVVRRVRRHRRAPRSRSRSAGFEVPVGAARRSARRSTSSPTPSTAGADNLLFAGQPLGNNVSPGDPPPPLGVAVGDDPACNSTTRILDDSICVLGTAVATKAPGARGLPRGG